MKAGWEIKTLGEVCEDFADGDWIESKEHLFEAAFAATSKRVVVKSPDMPHPLAVNLAKVLLESCCVMMCILSVKLIYLLNRRN